MHLVTHHPFTSFIFSSIKACSKKHLKLIKHTYLRTNKTTIWRKFATHIKTSVGRTHWPHSVWGPSESPLMADVGGREESSSKILTCPFLLLCGRSAAARGLLLTPVLDYMHAQSSSGAMCMTSLTNRLVQFFPISKTPSTQHVF